MLDEIAQVPKKFEMAPFISAKHNFSLFIPPAFYAKPFQKVRIAPGFQKTLTQMRFFLNYFHNMPFIKLLNLLNYKVFKLNYVISNGKTS